MSQNKFQQLIETLNTELVVLIDDDFIPVTKTGDALCHIFYLDSVDYVLFLDRLAIVEPSISQPISDLIASLRELTLSKDDYTYLGAGLLSEMLEARKESALKKQADAVYDLVKGLADSSEFFYLVMTYGLRPAGTEKYDGFFKGIEACKKSKSIRLYKGIEGAQFTTFEQEILAVNREKNNKFPLLIVDKTLANGQNGNDIITNLREQPNNINHFFSVLYTSQGEESLESYYHIQLRKDDENALEKVSEALALSAFATFFEQIHKHRTTALEDAQKLILESGVQNMVYLAGMANDEGDTVFNVFKNWFDLLTDKKVQEELIRIDPEGFDLSFMSNLTNLINSDFLSVITGTPEENKDFHTELRQLATFEIYDEQINQFCSPPAVGDIYDVNGQLYILAGQECDLVVRSSGGDVNRNEKLAELVKCSFSENSLDVKIDDSKSDIVPVNHFVLNGVKGSLELKLNQKDFFDFRLLDLCCTNFSGDAILSSNPLPEEVVNLLPTKWQDYLPKLFKQIGEKVKVQKFLAQEGINPDSLTGDSSLNIPFEELQEGAGIKFPIKRLGRMKGQFREYVMQRYWQYKTRQGLNTIGIYQRRQTQIDNLQVGFSYDLKPINGSHVAWLQLTDDRQKNLKKSSLDLFLTKEHILDVVREDHKHLISAFDGHEVMIPSKGVYEQNKVSISKSWEKNNLAVEIVLPIKNVYSDWYIKVERKMSLTQLFGKEFINQNETINKALFVTTEATTPFKGEGGRQHWVSIDDLNAGEIHLPEENLILKFDAENGVIDVTGPIKNEE